MCHKTSSEKLNDQSLGCKLETRYPKNDCGQVWKSGFRGEEFFESLPGTMDHRLMTYEVHQVMSRSRWAKKKLQS